MASRLEQTITAPATPDTNPSLTSDYRSDARDLRHNQSRSYGRFDPSLIAPLAKLALPTVAVMFLVTILSVAETYFVSTLGTSAVAAASLVVPVVLLVTMVSNGGIGGGVSSAIARARGAGNQVKAESLLWHALLLAALLGAATTAALWVFGPALYRALGGRDAALAGAIQYSNVLFGGSILSWALMLTQAALRGAGNVRVPALVVAGSVMIGLIASPLLITGALAWPGFGLVGAGIAQVATNAGALVVLLAYLRRQRATLRLRSHPVSAAHFREILAVGIPSSINAVLSALALTAATAAAGAYGATALAGYGLASRLDTLLVPILFGFGTAALTMVGTSLGRGDVQTARNAALTNMMLVAGALQIFGLVVATWPGLWLSLFTHDPAVLATGTDYLRIIAPTFGLSAVSMELYFAGQGARRIFWPMVATAVRLACALLAVVLVRTDLVNLVAAFAAVAAGITAAGVITLTGFLFSNWSKETRP